jgi:hypothetical protein
VTPPAAPTLTTRLVLTVVATAWLVGGAGCSRLVKGQQVAEFRGHSTRLGVAPVDGQYALFNKYSTTPRGAWVLRKGERLGFMPGPDGRVTAIAGAHEIDLPDGWYVWKCRPVR